MQRALKFIGCLLTLFLLTSNIWAEPSNSDWYGQDKNKNMYINVHLFLSSTCPYCHKADQFFKGVESDYPWLHMERHFIDKDKKALVLFNQLLKNQNMDDFSVPSVYFCNSRWTGYSSDETTGKDLISALEFCKQQIIKKGRLTKATVEVLQHKANANQFDAGIIGNPSPIKYISIVALLDAFNPCSLFLFMGFVSLLLVQKNLKIQVKSASIYILTLGIMHYIQQSQSQIYYEVLYWIRIPSVLAGLFIVYACYTAYNNKSLNRLFYYIAFILALFISLYQQTCIMNWSFIFQQWLSNQSGTDIQLALYQTGFQFLYILPLALFYWLYTIVLRIPFFKKRDKTLESVGLLYWLVLGLILIFYPFMLTNFTASLVLFPSIGIIGWYISSRRI